MVRIGDCPATLPPGVILYVLEAQARGTYGVPPLWGLACFHHPWGAEGKDRHPGEPYVHPSPGYGRPAYVAGQDAELCRPKMVALDDYGSGLVAPCYSARGREPRWSRGGVF